MKVWWCWTSFLFGPEGGARRPVQVGDWPLSGVHTLLVSYDYYCSGLCNKEKHKRVNCVILIFHSILIPSAEIIPHSLVGSCLSLVLHYAFGLTVGA